MRCQMCYSSGGRLVKKYGLAAPIQMQAPKWRNWQTRYVQGVVGISPWEFKSPLRHPRGSNSAGRVPAFQAGCRGFEPRLPLQSPTSAVLRSMMTLVAGGGNFTIYRQSRRGPVDHAHPGRFANRHYSEPGGWWDASCHYGASHPPGFRPRIRVRGRLSIAGKTKRGACVCSARARLGRLANCACSGGCLGWAECRRRCVDVGGGIAVGVLSRDVSAWIPAFAGMTNGGAPE